MRGPGSALVALAVLAVTFVAGGSVAQQPGGFDTPEATRAALAEARVQGEQARKRAERLEGEAAKVTDAADRTASEAAAIAARIQQAEAEASGQEARIRALTAQRSVFNARLAARQKPLVELTAALQRLARRPPVLSLLRPGSLSDTVHMRALLAAMLPEVEARTLALKADIERSRALQVQTTLAMRDLRRSQRQLAARRKVLAGLESRQRLASRAVTGEADREAERALALAEQARDLGSLVQDLDRAGALRQQLAALPGPILRPAQPAASRVADVPPVTAARPGLATYMLPVTGRLVAGFGEGAAGQMRSRGITLATRVGAMAVAPAAGRVIFAGPYSGYGQIVIIEHAGGWTTLVTGLAQLDTRVGAVLVGGAPLGQVGGGQPRLTLELRRDGVPVNPLDHLRAS